MTSEILDIMEERRLAKKACKNTSESNIPDIHRKIEAKNTWLARQYSRGIAYEARSSTSIRN
jgi:hypothetical protein